MKMRLSVAMLIALCGTLVPRGVRAAEEDRLPGVEADVVYGHKDGLALTLDVYTPKAEPNGAAILFMVSGGWYSRWAPPAQAKPMFQPYLDKGYTMIAVRHGSSPRYSIPEAVADVRLAVRFVRHNAKRFQLDPGRLGVMGMSAGGHLALMLGTTGEDRSTSAKGLAAVSSRVAAVVAIVPPTDLRVAVWEAPESLPAYRNYPALNLPLKEAGENSPLVQVSSDDAPSLVIMGGKDTLVPPKHGHWIDEAFETTGVEHKLLVFKGAGHGLQGPENRARMILESGNWFDRYMAKRQ